MRPERLPSPWKRFKRTPDIRRYNRHAAPDGDKPRARFRAAQVLILGARPFGKHHERPARTKDTQRLSYRRQITPSPFYRKRVDRPHRFRGPSGLKQGVPRHVIKRPVERCPQKDRIKKAHVIGNEQERALIRDILPPGNLEIQEQSEKCLEKRPPYEIPH